MRLKVLKFGGTSVGSGPALRRAVEIIGRELPQGGVVVVSAVRGATDGILRAVRAARAGEAEASQEEMRALRRRHLDLAAELELTTAVDGEWNPLLSRLDGLLAGMGLLQEAPPRSVDAALAVGETLSAHLLVAMLNRCGRPAEFRDVRQVLLTDARHGQARPRPADIRPAARPWRVDLLAGRLLVTQGFLGSSPDGSTTTLGRGGSDTSATLLGEALGAEEVQIWTDVDGVLTADPSLVPTARPIRLMSDEEAAALSAFGAKVLHADSLAPHVRAGFRLVVANTLRPDNGRTEIAAAPPPRRPGEVTSVAYKEGLALLRFGPPFHLEDILEAVLRLKEAGATRYALVSSPGGTVLALRADTPAAEAELAELVSAGVQMERGWAVVALVGEGLREDPGPALRLLASLNGERIGAILTGASTLSVGFLVPETRLPELIPTLHAACLSQPGETS